MTLKRRGVACDANFFVCVLLYSKILLQLCQLYSKGQYIVELTLYQTLESGKDTLLTYQTTVAMSHNKQLIDTVREGV